MKDWVALCVQNGGRGLVMEASATGYQEITNYHTGTNRRRGAGPKSSVPDWLGDKAHGAQGAQYIEINHRKLTEKSAWAIAELITWDRALTRAEMGQTMQYFVNLLSKGTPYRDLSPPSCGLGSYRQNFDYRFVHNGCCYSDPNVWDNARSVTQYGSFTKAECQALCDRHSTRTDHGKLAGDDYIYGPERDYFLPHETSAPTAKETGSCVAFDIKGCNVDSTDCGGTCVLHLGTAAPWGSGAGQSVNGNACVTNGDQRCFERRFGIHDGIQFKFEATEQTDTLIYDSVGGMIFAGVAGSGEVNPNLI